MATVFILHSQIRVRYLIFEQRTIDFEFFKLSGLNYILIAYFTKSSEITKLENFGKKKMIQQ